jgi:hypothetical protein
LKATGITLKRREGAHETMIHGEAFALMKYQNKVTGRVEWLWNSRDGVTPFVIDDPLVPPGEVQRFEQRRAKGKVDEAREPDPRHMAHADWHEDAFLPNFVPTDGTRIFMSWADAPESHKARVREAYVAYIESVRAGGGVSDEHCDGLLAGEPYSMKPTDPCVVVVTEELVEHFHKLASTNPFVPPSQAAAVERPKLITPADSAFGDFTKPLKL